MHIFADFSVKLACLGGCDHHGRKAVWRLALVTMLCAMGFARALAQTCPTEDPAIDSAKSHKLFLYFPTTADSSFPNYAANVSPAQLFDMSSLNPAIGTTAQLIDTIKDVVIDDYCEFNVQVLSTTTNPATLPSPPPRRSTIAVGADVNGSSIGGSWGQAQEVDTGDSIDIDFARVWAGTYTVCEGGNGPTATGGCSNTGSLTGANATLQNWGQAIGGTAAHEAGHTYGLSHEDDDPQNDPCSAQPGFPPTAGEDAFNRHLMPAGCNLTGPDRTTFRRHFSDRDYGILATNVGLSIETMHNWNLVNPNAQQGASLAIDFLSTLPSVSPAWTYAGSQSPWITPTVSGPMGTAVFKGKTYNKFRITWSTGNPAWTNPSPGIVGGGAVFHVGATFTGVDFNQPDPIIIQDVTLADASSNPLTLHPRLPSYDAGTLDTTGNLLAVNFFPPPNAPEMRLVSATVMQLPRVATIDSLVGEGHPFTRDKSTIQPWATTNCDAGPLREGLRCVVAQLDQRPHVAVSNTVGQPGVYDCRQGVPRVPSPRRQKTPGDSTFSPDYEGPVVPPGARKPLPNGTQDSTFSPDDEAPICAGSVRDPFPSATVYVIATFVDPNVRHYDPTTNAYVIGPVTSKLYYQFAGIRQLPAEHKGPMQESWVFIIWITIFFLLLVALLIWWRRRVHA
jgi:hypothetical protein